MRHDTFDLHRIAAAVNQDTRIVFLANPNNPTGTVVTADEVDEFLDQIPEHVVVVLDEAYYEFALHFAALRALGVSVPEAVIADPEGGRARLLRTAWPEEAADELVAAAERKPDLHERWKQAEALTDDRIGELLASSLTEAEQAEFERLLVDLAEFAQVPASPGT